MEGEQVEFILFPKPLGGPVVLLGGSFDVAQNGADVNRLAVVTAVVFIQALHGNILLRMRGLTRGFISLSPPNGARAGARGSFRLDA